MIGPAQTGKPLTAGVYLTRGARERFEWWRYFDGHSWSKGFWFGSQCREFFKDRTWPLNDKEIDFKPMQYFKENLPDV